MDTLDGYSWPAVTAFWTLEGLRLRKILYFCGVKRQNEHNQASAKRPDGRLLRRSASLSGLMARIIAAVFIAATVIVAGCSSTKHVPDGRMLLDKVSINVVADSSGVSESVDEQETLINGTELYNFLRQQPNHKVLGFAKLQLATYSLSGRDSTKWYNKWLRRLGQPPVIYDEDLTELSRRQLRQALVNRGYLDATVIVDTTARRDKKRMEVKYNIYPGRPHVIGGFAYASTDSLVGQLVEADSANRMIGPGDIFDRNVLDSERARLTRLLRDHGYYSFNRECITFVADTAAGSKILDLTMHIQPPRVSGSAASDGEMRQHRKYRVREVCFVTDYNSFSGSNDGDQGRDTMRYDGFVFVYGKDRYIKPQILAEKCMIKTGEPYNASDVERTYENLSQLGILKFINIEMEPVAYVDGYEWLDCRILLSRNKKQSIAVELEGTNSEGDLGVGVGLTYQHRNLAHGSQLLTAKLRGSYESLSGDFEGLINNRYTEIAGEVGITFPKFEAPFLSKSFKQRIRAVTEFSVSANYQERPEYTRIIAGGAWKYKWTSGRGLGYRNNNTFDLIDINYVYLPHSTLDFLDQIAPSNPLLRYSYEDHFIMRMGYNFYRTNRRIPTGNANSFTIQPTVTTLRAGVEVAGNLLHAISSAVGQKKSDGAYKVFGIQYAQYVKGEIDFTHLINLNSRNAIAMRAGFGIAYPYGNSSMVPFEKRFYAGGANSVRGWGVRTLGPGNYRSQNNVLNFINQCGDILLNLNLEYRAKLFWVFEGALFVDAGNIWTIRNYENQPGGLFKFDRFYKEIAIGYGIGLRMDFTYFLLRLDLGMKAHNPAEGEERWPLIHPKWGRDHTFNFAVGYPF